MLLPSFMYFVLYDLNFLTFCPRRMNSLLWGGKKFACSWHQIICGTVMEPSIQWYLTGPLPHGPRQSERGPRAHVDAPTGGCHHALPCQPCGTHGCEASEHLSGREPKRQARRFCMLMCGARCGMIWSWGQQLSTWWGGCLVYCCLAYGLMVERRAFEAQNTKETGYA